MNDEYVKYVLLKDLIGCPKGRIFKQDAMGGFFHSMSDQEAIEGKLKMYLFKKDEVINNPEWFRKYNPSNPTMTFNFRISIDETHKQRFTEEEVMTEIKNNNVIIQNRLLVRKRDGKIIGEILV